MKTDKICFLIPHMRGGGAERVVANLVSGLADAGYDADLLVLSEMEGAHKNDVSEKVKIVELGISSNASELPAHKDRTLWARVKIALSVIPSVFSFFAKSLPRLVGYWETARPDVVFCNLYYGAPSVVNFFSKHKAKIVCVEHGSLGNPDMKSMRPSKIFWRFFYSAAYRKADLIVGVSKGLLGEATALGVPAEKTMCVYNPIVSELLKSKIRITIQNKNSRGHDFPSGWFSPKLDIESPVFLAVGRLSWEKNFAAMFEAFAKFAKTKDARLLILGEGPLRPKLEELVRDLRMEGKIAMPGWAQDPFAYMVQADVFLLSSLYEGLPTVLVEALACGRTIVSTRCQYGPEEILDNGRYGYLVPVGDTDAMAEAMQTALNRPFDIEVLQKRAEDFSFENAISAYESIIQRLHGVTDDCPCRADNKRVS